MKTITPFEDFKERIRKYDVEKEMPFLERFFTRIFSKYIVFFLAKTRVTPNMVTMTQLLVVLCSAFLFAQGELLAIFLATFLLLFSYVLDCVDGELARSKNMKTLRGRYLEDMVCWISTAAIWIGVGFGFFNHTGNSIYLALGIFLGFLTTNFLHIGVIQTIYFIATEKREKTKPTTKQNIQENPNNKETNEKETPFLISFRRIYSFMNQSTAQPNQITAITIVMVIEFILFALDFTRFQFVLLKFLFFYYLLFFACREIGGIIKNSQDAEIEAKMEKLYHGLQEHYKKR